MTPYDAITQHFDLNFEPVQRLKGTRKRMILGFRHRRLRFRSQFGTVPTWNGPGTKKPIFVAGPKKLIFHQHVGYHFNRLDETNRLTVRLQKLVHWVSNTCLFSTLDQSLLYWENKDRPRTLKKN